MTFCRNKMSYKLIMIGEKRIAWIDVAKGICMISVVAGHLGVTEINNVVFAFHLTVFFILSGYTLKISDLNREYLNKKFKSLMIPYFITCACIMVMDVFNAIWWNHDASIEGVTGIISMDLIRSFAASGSIQVIGNIDIDSRIGAIWFLPALFFAQIFSQIILKYIANNKKKLIAGFVLLVIAYISGNIVWLPFSIQSAMFAVPFILIGYELRHSDILKNLNWRKSIVCLLIFAFCIILQKSKILFVNASMDDLVISTISGISSSFLILFLSMKSEKCRPLAWIGRHSLVFLCVHDFEMETMWDWYNSVFDHLSIPFTEFPSFCIQIIFTIIVTAGILWLKNLITNKRSRSIKAISDTKDNSIEIADGILAALMLVGYYVVEVSFRSIIYSFYIVAFVFLSGYLFKQSSIENIPKKIWELCKLFLIPYVIFAAVSIFMSGTNNIRTVLLGMSNVNNITPTGIDSIGPVYLLLIMFLVQVLYLFIERYCQSEYWKFGICIMISISGVFLGQNGYWLPWNLECAMYSLIFYYLGHLFKKYNLLGFFKDNLISYFVLSIVWAFMIYMGGLEFDKRNYGSYGLTILGVLSATVLLYMFSCYLYDKFPVCISNIICITGESTVYILIIYSLFNEVIQNVVSLMFGVGYIYHMGLSIILEICAGILVYFIVGKVKSLCIRLKDQLSINA